MPDRPMLSANALAAFHTPLPVELLTEPHVDKLIEAAEALAAVVWAEAQAAARVKTTMRADGARNEQFDRLRLHTETVAKNERLDWADYLESRGKAPGDPEPTVADIVKLLRAEERPFGTATTHD